MIATNAGRMVRIPIAALVGFLLTLVLFAGTFVSQAQAQTYTPQSFSCGGGHNSGSYDKLGNLYIPCSTKNLSTVKNAGTADKSAPSHIRKYSPEGVLLKQITLPTNTNTPTSDDLFVYDVAPGPGGNTLYITSAINEVVQPVKKLQLTSGTNTGTLTDFAPRRAWKLTTDASGYVYISDNPTKKVFKYHPDKTLKASFNARPSGDGDIGGIAVNSTGSVLYVTQMKGVGDNLINKVNRFTSSNGTTYVPDTSTKSPGGIYDPNKPCATDLYNDPKNTPAPYWIKYFAYSWDIGLDAQQNLYALSTTCHEVHKFRPDGSWVMGLKVNAEDRYETTYADYGRPHGLAVARNGEVYIGEANAKMGLIVPNTLITGGPKENETNPDTTPTFTFASDPAGAIFKCKLDSATTFTSCASSYTTPTLPVGAHKLTVKAVNTKGEDPTPAVRNWKVGNPPTEPCDATVDDGSANVKKGDMLANTMNGDAINERLCGLGGNDAISPGDGFDKVDGGTGSDTIVYLSATAKVTILLTSKEAYDPDADGLDASIDYDTFLNIENARGSNHSDTIIGDNLPNILIGGDGVSDGSDSLRGESGNDTINARDGMADSVNCGDGTDRAIVDASDTVDANCETKELP